MSQKLINTWTGKPWCERCSRMGCPGGTIGHLRFEFWIRRLAFAKYVRAWLRSFTALDYSKIEDVEVDGIDTRDYPDFVDAYISSATYKGRDMTERELERLNEDSSYVYDCVQERLY